MSSQHAGHELYSHYAADEIPLCVSSQVSVVIDGLTYGDAVTISPPERVISPMIRVQQMRSSIGL